MNNINLINTTNAIALDLLKELNLDSKRLILRGEAILILFYGLNLHCDTLELEGTFRDIEYTTLFIKKYCDKKQCSYKLVLNKKYKKRYIIYFENSNNTLNIDLDFTNINLNLDTAVEIDNILMYDLSSSVGFLILDKEINKKRYINNITFVVINYWNQLDLIIKSYIKEYVFYKGYEYFLNIIGEYQNDHISKEESIENVNKMFEILGLLCDNN